MAFDKNHFDQNQFRDIKSIIIIDNRDIKTVVVNLIVALQKVQLNDETSSMQH